MASFVLFSPTEAEVGVEYARHKYGVDVSLEFLVALANKIRAAMALQFLDFPTARYQVLNGAHLYAKSKEAKRKRDAYKGALGKIFNRRKQFQKKRRAARKVSAEHQSRARHSANEKGQLEWIF